MELRIWKIKDKRRRKRKRIEREGVKIKIERIGEKTNRTKEG